MNELDLLLRRVSTQQARVRTAEARLDAERQTLHEHIVAARQGGASISDIARATGVSRQRASQILQREAS